MIRSVSASPPAEPTMPPVREWRIHLGAHKTATTHLQETLEAMRSGLSEDGVDFIANRDLRKQGLARSLLKPGLAQAYVPLLRRSAMQRVLAQDLAPLRSGAPTVVLSEENLLGSVRRVFSGAIYPRAEISVAMLANLAREAQLTFFLSIRSFDKFLPSAYAEALKWGPPPEGGFDGVRRAAAASRPSWFGFFERLRIAADGVPIRIWRQEDYRDHKTEILGAVCGCAIHTLPELPDPVWTSSPSAQAIARAEALPDTLAGRARWRAVKAAYATTAPDQPPFAPFSRTEQDTLHAAYETDLERIERRAPGSLMQF